MTEPTHSGFDRGVDEVRVLRELLSAHRTVVLGALHANAAVDIDGAFQIHAALSRILACWDEFTICQQREIVRTIEYVINTDDDIPDLLDPNGFRDDLERLRRLQDFLDRV